MKKEAMPTVYGGGNFLKTENKWFEGGSINRKLSKHQ